MQRRWAQSKASSFALCACVVSWLLFSAAGCSGSSDDNDNDDDADGVAGCQQWRRALCDFVERCGADGTTCREQGPAYECRADVDVQSCPALLATAECTNSAIAGCGIADVADPAPAVTKCEAFVEALCDRLEQCEPGSRADCLASASDSLDCSAALGAMPSYEQCVSEVSTLECTTSTAPDACAGVFLVE